MIFAPGPWFRVLFLFLAAVILIGIVTISGDKETGNFIIPLIIAAVCMAAAMYRESWTFDRDLKLITYCNGLIFFNRTKRYSFEDILNFEFSFFLRGAESDGSADHEINLGNPFSKENTEEVAGRSTRIIHKRYHQELRLNLKSGNHAIIESLDSRNTEKLIKNATILSEFSGIGLEK